MEGGVRVASCQMRAEMRDASRLSQRLSLEKKRGVACLLLGILFPG